MKSNIELDRRKVLGTVGGLAAAGSGLALFTGESAATASVGIKAGNPQKLKNDRGDLSRVTIDPTFRVEWENFDEAIGKVFYVIEAKLGKKNQGGTYHPIFRSTPWLTGDTLQGVDASDPGTSGHLEYVDPLSKILNRSTNARNASNEDPRPLPRPVEVVNEHGRPDYESADFGYAGGVTAESYVNGLSVGSADDAEQNLDLPLVNNFPGAESGYYGAAADTSAFDDDNEQAGPTKNFVTLRYTFAFYTVNQSLVNATGDSVGEGVLSDVRHVREDNQGHSLLVMNGEDGYPSLPDPASNKYPDLQAIAADHPAVLTTEDHFLVRVQNEKSDASVTGESNTGAS